MKIACNYYKETEQLLDENRIDIDYFKYPGLGFQMKIMEDLDAFESFCNRVTEKRPILLHGLYPAPHDLSSPSLLKDFDYDITGKLIQITKTPGLSFHSALEKVPTEISFNNTLDTIIQNAGYIKERYADLDFISIENADSPRWGDLLKPEIITRIITESGCGFLFDISHAYCASKWLNTPFFDYIKQLPLEKITEIHINGWHETQDDIMCHTKINDEGYKALEFILEYCRPEVITIEYGRPNDRMGAGIPVLSEEQINEQAKDEIEEQVYKIREICSRTKI